MARQSRFHGVREGASLALAFGLRRVGVLAVAGVLGGCALVPKEPLVHQPMTARADPYAPPASRLTNGSIFVGGGQGIALFEDRRPRSVGDILTIVISEKINASKNSGANATRTSSTGAAFELVPKVLGGLLKDQDAKLSGSSALNAKGGASAANNFNGVITVTVTDVLPNGNLLVSGEKQMGINQGTEFIRFSGVVNPRTVTGNNTVLSTQVADARIEYTAKGYIDESQQMGWLQRFFLNVMPY
ncbi:flagellar basal body L-ring protein FlgH [Variovorax sp.]|uniref:flagellar basal body L-ring protein FlgH n=1 Tax=Variovorax sp. TaxID=1871043 RepID=UPI002D3F6D5F|nr:flagellar basal body L-ring protein FlgH [Variovorax sp.]HYP85639.1 flagellar basal body L-ring protein FlgH [Variovorax sp.]